MVQDTEYLKSGVCLRFAQTVLFPEPEGPETTNRIPERLILVLFNMVHDTPAFRMWHANNRSEKYQGEEPASAQQGVLPARGFLPK